MVKALFCFFALLAVSLALSLILLFVPSITNFWVRMILQLSLYLGFFVVFLLFRQSVDKSDFNFRVKPFNIVLLVLAGLCCLVAFMLVQFGFADLYALISSITGLPDMGSNNAGVSTNIWQYLMLVLVVGIVPPIVEELLFRGVIFKELSKVNKWVAVFGSALLFALFHMNPAQFVFQFIMGVIYGFVVMRTGNVIHAMILHFVNNFSLVTLIYIVGNNVGYSWTDPWTSVTMVLLALLGGAIIMGLVSGLVKEKHAK
jgi:membrane protease YdiL (CAAX protease family)